MNKKVLSAILFSALFAGTGTFTSCIDTDEPEGITNLRGAKAELIRAKVAVEAANAAYVQAQAQLILAKTKTEEALARWKEADAACKEAEAEKAAAETAEAKAKAEAAIKKAQEEMAEATLAHDAEILRLKGELAKQQQTYEATLAAIEAAKLTLTEEEQAVLDKAQLAMTTAADAVNGAYAAYVEAQGKVNSMMTTKAKVTLAQLKAELAYEQAKLNSAEFSVVKAEEQLALAEKFDAETWNAQIAELKSQKQALNASLDSAEVELQKVYVGDEYQAAEDAYALAVETLGANEVVKGAVDKDKKNYVKGAIGAAIKITSEEEAYKQTIGETEELTKNAKMWLAKDSLDKALNGTLEDEDKNKITLFKLAAYESSVIDPSLMEFIEKSDLFTGLVKSNDDKESVFKYDEQEYTEGGYQKQLEYLAADEEYEAAAGALYVKQYLTKVYDALEKFDTDKNGEAWAGIEVEKLKADLETTKATYKADSIAWDIMLKAYKGEKTDAPTNVAKWTKAEIDADVDAAVDAYNTAYGLVGTAVTAYNASLTAYKTASDAVYTAAYNAKVAEEKNAYYISQYYSYAKSSLTSAQQTTWEGLPAASQTEATLDAYINDKATSDAFKAKALTDQAKHYASAKVNDKETNPVLIALDANAKTAGELAVSADEDETIKEALDAIKDTDEGTLVAMTDAIDDAVDAYAKLQTVVANYQEMLATDYGQVLVGKNLTNMGDETIAVGSKTYVNKLGAIQWSIISSDLKLSDVAGDYIANEKKDDGKTDKDPIGIYYYKTLTTKVSDITADEEKNLVLADLNEDDQEIKKQLTAKSKTAFGDLAWDDKNNEFRAVAPEREEVEAYVEANKTVKLEDCGSLGKLLAAEDNIALYEDMATAGELVDPLMAEIDAQLKAVQEEIDANSAIVAAYQTKYDAAEDAYEAGEDAIEAAKDAREAVCAANEALVDEFEEKVSYVELLINTAQAQLDAMYNGDGANKPINAEQVVAYWKEQVALAEKNLATQQDAVIEAEMAIEQFNAGTYSEELQYKQAILKLETATAAYEAALEVYNQRLAELQAVIEALAK